MHPDRRVVGFVSCLLSVGGLWGLVNMLRGVLAGALSVGSALLLVGLLYLLCLLAGVLLWRGSEPGSWLAVLCLALQVPVINVAPLRYAFCTLLSVEGTISSSLDVSGFVTAGSEFAFRTPAANPTGAVGVNFVAALLLWRLLARRQTVVARANVVVDA